MKKKLEETFVGNNSNKTLVLTKNTSLTIKDNNLLNKKILTTVNMNKKNNNISLYMYLIIYIKKIIKLIKCYLKHI